MSRSYVGALLSGLLVYWLACLKVVGDGNEYLHTWWMEQTCAIYSFEYKGRTTWREPAETMG